MNNEFYLVLYQKSIDFFVEYSKSLLEGIILFSIFFVLATIVKRVIVKTAKKVCPEKQVIFNLIANSAKTVLLVIGIITALGTMDIDISALVAGLGLTGFAVGYALKDSISNLMSGVLVLLYQPFKIGDHIEVAGLSGLVKKIDLRYTTLSTDSKNILVPNTLVFTKTVTILQK